MGIAIQTCCFSRFGCGASLGGLLTSFGGFVILWWFCSNLVDLWCFSGLMKDLVNLVSWCFINFGFLLVVYVFCSFCCFAVLLFWYCLL